MVRYNQHRISGFGVMEDHMTALLSGQIVTNPFKCFEGLTAGNVCQSGHFEFILKKWGWLHNVLQMSRMEYTRHFPWQHGDSHELLRECYEEQSPLSFPETYNQADWDNRQHSRYIQNRMLIQHGISFLTSVFIVFSNKVAQIIGKSQNICQYEGKGTK